MNVIHDQVDRVDRARLVGSGGARRVHGSSARGGEGFREGVFQSATSTRPSRERNRGRTQDQGVVRRLDENFIDEFHVSSKTTDNCVEPTIIQSVT